MKPQTISPSALEQTLRSRMTEIEYRTLQARLTGAVKAVAMLRECAPDLLPLMFGDSLDRARTLPPKTQGALAVLIDELLAAAATTSTGAVDRKRLLAIVKRVSAHT